MKTVTLRINHWKETDQAGRPVAELTGYRLTEAGTVENVWHSFGETEALAASAADIELYRAASALHWIEQAACRLRHRAASEPAPAS